MQLEVSARAQKDIDQVFFPGLEEFGKAQALLYSSAMFDLFELILVNPKMGNERTEFKRKPRSIHFKSHIIFYRVSRSKVRIIRVLHGRQNWVDHL
jgi:toxin ParE1/3/4